MTPRPADLGALCRDVFEEMQAACPDRGIVAGIADELTASVDAARMRQVLANLLGNAVQHGDAQAPIPFTVTREGDDAVIEVHNRGRPIAPDRLQVVFEPLVQIPDGNEDRDHRPNTSLGLGLYIARETVSAHGGVISVTSTQAGGTTFSVRLPVGPPAQAHAG